MEFDWDPAKAASNERKHHVRFSAAVEVFLDPNRADFDVTRGGDGEVRRKVVGQVNGRLFTLVYTVRADVIRVISARRANLQEMQRYGDR